jgi:hypothetical protein
MALPAADGESAQELVTALALELKALRRPWKLSLDGLSETDKLLPCLREQFGWSEFTASFVAPVLRFDKRLPVTTYVSRNSRSAAAKAINKLRSAGLEHCFKWTIDRDEIAALVPIIIDLYERRTVQLHQKDLLSDPLYRKYFAAMIRALILDGEATLLTTTVEASLAAYALCLRERDELFVYSNRMDPRFARYSAGLLTNIEVVRKAHASNNIRTLNWGAGIQRYKLSGGAEIVSYGSFVAWSGGVSKFAGDVSQKLINFRDGRHRIHAEQIVSMVGDDTP